MQRFAMWLKHVKKIPASEQIFTPHPFRKACQKFKKTINKRQQTGSVPEDNFLP